MKDQRRFATQTLIITLFFNTILLIAVLLVAGGVVFSRALISILIGAAITLGLWFVLQRIGRRFIERAAPADQATPRPARADVQTPASEASALQLLAILQRKGRLVDFLQEDLDAYKDDQIGAAVRNIHAGCKQALSEYVQLEPIYKEAEGSQITIEPGFDNRAVRLVGNVMGDPPFKGALRHRGWRIVSIDLPARVQGQEQDRILAAAEVEVTT